MRLFYNSNRFRTFVSPKLRLQFEFRFGSANICKVRRFFSLSSLPWRGQVCVIQQPKLSSPSTQLNEASQTKITEFPTRAFFSHFSRILTTINYQKATQHCSAGLVELFFVFRSSKKNRLTWNETARQPPIFDQFLLRIQSIRTCSNLFTLNSRFRCCSIVFHKFFSYFVWGDLSWGWDLENN